MIKKVTTSTTTTANTTLTTKNQGDYVLQKG